MKTQSQTRYQVNRQAIDQHLKAIQKAVKEMDKSQKQEPQDWGYVANAAHIADQLKEICEFLNADKYK